MVFFTKKKWSGIEKLNAYYLRLLAIYSCCFFVSSDDMKKYDSFRWSLGSLDNTTHENTGVFGRRLFPGIIRNTKMHVCLCGRCRMHVCFVSAALCRWTKGGEEKKQKRAASSNELQANFLRAFPGVFLQVYVSIQSVLHPVLLRTYYIIIVSVFTFYRFRVLSFGIGEA